MTPLEVLRATTFGKRTAEEEREQLRAYFVETEQWKRVFAGEIDVIYGMKGSGKSAIYSLIEQSRDDLLKRDIIVVPGENPQGTPVFRDIGVNPPDSEKEFIGLWKLYILALCANTMKEHGIIEGKASAFIAEIERAGLLPSTFSLTRALTYVFDYVRRMFRAEALEGTVGLDPATGMPNGVSGKIIFREPGFAQSKLGLVSVDDLFRMANDALVESGKTVWILLDRLDVAFVDKPDTETVALRSLFRFYLDTKGHRAICTKIFLRTDIWNDITRGGFREASHIEKSLDLRWNSEDLLNLLVRRALANAAICNYYDVTPQTVLSDFGAQEGFLASMFPAQVDSGPNKPATFKWILSRTRDAAQPNAPRELIHFMNELRSVQINRFERGVRPLADRKLFEQISFKEALPAVSKVKLEQTLYAEYVDMKPFVERLRYQKSTQTTASLAELWGLPVEQAEVTASRLEAVGFFERMGKSNWRVPFLYRPALDLIQGSADS